MIVIRMFGLLTGTTAQFTVHRSCCATGYCLEADEVAYAHSGEQAGKSDAIADVALGVLHGWISTRGDHALSDDLQSHLVRLPASL